MRYVKICGLRDPDGYEQMLAYPLNAIGFVFAPSKRRVEPIVAAKWREAIDRAYMNGTLSDPPHLVGVFVNPTIEEVFDAVVNGTIDVVQLHGQETYEQIFAIRKKLVQEAMKPIQVWKALTIVSGQTASVSVIQDQMTRLAPLCERFLVDTHDPTYGGGSGKTFSWDVIPALQETSQLLIRPLMIAGGLTVDNVSELLSQYDPDGVDISSGVEIDGVKDLNKIELFIKRVRMHDQMA